ncbi:hypothetical protein ACTXT7_009109, partial [Hymenolepis weldensis]
IPASSCLGKDKETPPPFPPSPSAFRMCWLSVGINAGRQTAYPIISPICQQTPLIFM